MRAKMIITQDHVRLSNHQPVRVQPVPRQTDHPPHGHEFYEICIVTGGRAQHVTIDSTERLERGCVIIVAPGQLHSFEQTKAFSVINIYYLAEWFLTDTQALQGIDRLIPLFFQRALFPSPDPAGIVQLRLDENTLADCLGDFEQLQREAESTGGETLFLEACFLKCLIRLARSHVRSLNGAGKLTWPEPVMRGLLEIERRVRTGDTPDMKTVASQAGASLSHFCRLFKLTTGLTAGDYFQRRRIHRACRRLLSSNATSAEIGHLLGFSDSAHFNRSFKKITGLTPQAYRRKFRIG